MKNLIHFLLFAFLSLAIGLGSAHQFVENGFALVAPQSGPWKTWINAGSLAADPYTRARIARLQRVGGPQFGPETWALVERAVLRACTRAGESNS